MNSLAEKVKDFVKPMSKDSWRAPSSYHKTLFEGKNYIDGQWSGVDKANPYHTKLNPSTGLPLGEFPLSGPSDVDEAVKAARKAFSSWKKVSRFVRSDYMNRVAQIIEKRKEELATVISLETGKNYNESVAEVNESLHMAQFAFGSGRYPHGEAVSSEVADKDSYMLRKPKGVIAIITPFNFPLAIGMFWNAAPAIVEGNTVVVKPSEDAPISTQLAMQIYEEAGLPRGVINLVHGCGDTGHLLVSHDIDHICFTGSAEVGQSIRRVAAESWHKTTSCEMGSKSAVVVFKDADTDLSIESCIASAFKLCGQRCVSASRLIVERSVVDVFAKRFVEKATALKIGNPFKQVVGTSGTPDAIGWVDHVPDESVYCGPLINEDAYQKVQVYNRLVAQDDECEVLLAPSYASTERELGGHYMTPMIYKTEWRDAPFLKEEVFGPHVAIIPFDTIEDAVRIYNDTDYGLAVGVLTNDFKKARIMRDECDAGMIYWNGGSIAAESHLAFGGVKKSGNGFPTAARTFRSVTHEISWTVNHAETLAFPQGMK